MAQLLEVEELLVGHQEYCDLKQMRVSFYASYRFKPVLNSKFSKNEYELRVFW